MTCSFTAERVQWNEADLSLIVKISGRLFMFKSLGIQVWAADAISAIERSTTGKAAGQELARERRKCPVREDRGVD